MEIEEVYEKQLLLNVENELVPCLVGFIDASLAAQLLDRLSYEDALPLSRYGLSHLKRIRKHSKQNNPRKNTGTVMQNESMAIDTSVDMKEHGDLIQEPRALQDSTQADNASNISTLEAKSKLVQILLVPTSYRNDISRVFQSVEGLSMSMIQDTITVDVPRYMPNHREEFDTWVKYWPINFRPSDADREREKGLPKCDVDLICAHLAGLQDECKHMKSLARSSAASGMIVNPLNNKVITTTTRSLNYLESIRGPLIHDHPIYTPTMILIEGVAALVRGDIPSECDLLPRDPYLCTGYDIYLAEEPDLMSSMALVHSRIRRVIYMESNLGNGALGSQQHLHQLRSLNHKFRVFRVKNTT